MSILTKQIQDKIIIKQTRTGKNGKDYLILELKDGEK